MNILFITNYSKISNGGDSRVPWEIARFASDNTNHNIFILTTGRNFSIEKDSISPKLTVIRVPSMKIYSTYRIFNVGIFSTKKLLDTIEELEIDIIHAHSYSFLAYIVQTLSKDRNIPFVYTSHLLPSKVLTSSKGKYFNKGLNPLKMPVDVYLKSFYKGCSSIVALNEYAYQDWQKYSPDTYPLTIIPNGSNFNLAEKSSFQDCPKDTDNIKLIFTGRITKFKNQEFLIKALNDIQTSKKIQLYLPGEGPMVSELKILAKDILRLDSKNIEVIFPGFIPHEEVHSLLKDSHFFISASLKEVQSLSVIEALASGTPVVAIENETTKELIEDEVNGYLLAKDTSTKYFAETLTNCFSMDKNEYISFCKSSVKSVEHLTWENVWKETEILYKDLLEEEPVSKKEEKTMEKLLEYIKNTFNISD